MKAQQRKVRTARNTTVVAFAFVVLGTLPSCDAQMPTDVRPSAVETVLDADTAKRSESEDEKCIVINGKIYCY